MWYKSDTISIGIQSGGLEDGGLGVLKVGLYRALIKHVKRTGCPAVDHFALVLRVSGRLDDFGPAGIERVRRSRKNRCVSVDIVVSLKDWKRRTPDQLRTYLAARVREALCACIARLRMGKEPIDEAGLLSNVDKAISEFRNERTVPALAEAEHRAVVDAVRRMKAAARPRARRR